MGGAPEPRTAARRDAEDRRNRAGVRDGGMALVATAAHGGPDARTAPRRQGLPGACPPAEPTHVLQPALAAGWASMTSPVQMTLCQFGKPGSKARLWPRNAAPMGVFSYGARSLSASDEASDHTTISMISAPWPGRRSAPFYRRVMRATARASISCARFGSPGCGKFFQRTRK